MKAAVLREINQPLVIEDISIVPVSSVETVLQNSLTKELKPIDWVEVELD